MPQSDVGCSGPRESMERLGHGHCEEREGGVTVKCQSHPSVTESVNQPRSRTRTVNKGSLSVEGQHPI